LAHHADNPRSGAAQCAPAAQLPEGGPTAIALAGAAEAALEQARRSVGLLETLLDELADGVLALDRRGRVIHWSSSLAALTGVPAVEALGRTGRELVGELSERVVAADRRTVTGCLQLPGGRELPVRLAAVTSHGAGGVVVGWVCAVTDLRGCWAERAEEQRASALADLGRGLAAALHQVRNPLGAAAGFAELLERDLEGSSAARLAVKVRESLQEIDRRIGEVLTYARPRPLDVTTFDARELLVAVVEQVRARFPSGPVPVLEAQGAVQVRADRNQLGQALENLLANACEAAGTRGEVRLLLQRAPATRQPGDGDVRMLIRNTGDPLAPERLAEIFEPFCTGKCGGTGLGLPLARRIIDAHGGRISALSAGGWTTFVVTLPSDVVAGEEETDEEHACGAGRSEAA